MTTSHRKYRASDFLGVRDLLVRTCRAFDPPLNWGIERWNYARYLVAPYLSDYGKDAPSTDGKEGIRAWEEAIEVWEDGEGAVEGGAVPGRQVGQGVAIVGSRSIVHPHPPQSSQVGRL